MLINLPQYILFSVHVFTPVIKSSSGKEVHYVLFSKDRQIPAVFVPEFGVLSFVILVGPA
jgi:predicted N-formylglutamate amidohydrolase